jgi:hypothetical protein
MPKNWLQIEYHHHGICSVAIIYLLLFIKEQCVILKFFNIWYGN